MRISLAHFNPKRRAEDPRLGRSLAHAVLRSCLIMVPLTIGAYVGQNTAAPVIEFDAPLLPQTQPSVATEVARLTANLTCWSPEDRPLMPFPGKIVYAMENEAPRVGGAEEVKMGLDHVFTDLYPSMEVYAFCA